MLDRGADRTRQQRDAMADLLAAVTDPNQAVRAMSLRVRAKVALAALLQQGRFGSDVALALCARHQARALLAQCADMVLS